MQSFLNSPPGPLGGAGQTGTSTTPQNLFNNAAGFGSKFGQGIEAFKQNYGNDPGELLKSLFGNLFGGDGGILGGLGGMFGNKGMGGIPGNLAKIPGGIGQIPQNLANIFARPQGQAPTGVSPGAGMPNAPVGGGGILSRFMPRSS